MAIIISKGFSVTLDSIAVSYRSAVIMSKYKNVVKNVEDLTGSEDLLKDMLKEYVSEEDLELMTAFADMTVAIANFKKIANEKE